MSFQKVANQSIAQQPIILPVVKPAGTVGVADMNNHNEPRIQCHA